MSQLARIGKLNRFPHQPTRQFGHLGAEFHKGGSPSLAQGTINIILARPRNNGTSGTEIMSVGMGYDIEADDQAPKRSRVIVTPNLGFSKEDK